MTGDVLHSIIILIIVNIAVVLAASVVTGHILHSIIIILIIADISVVVLAASVVTGRIRHTNNEDYDIAAILAK